MNAKAKSIQNRMRARVERIADDWRRGTLLPVGERVRLYHAQACDLRYWCQRIGVVFEGLSCEGEGKPFVMRYAVEGQRYEVQA